MNNMFTSRNRDNYLLYMIMQFDNKLFICSIYRLRGHNYLYGVNSKCEHKQAYPVTSANGYKGCILGGTF